MVNKQIKLAMDSYKAIGCGRDDIALVQGKSFPLFYLYIVIFGLSEKPLGVTVLVKLNISH